MQSLSSTSCRRNISGRQIYMYMSIADLEKAFDRVHLKVLWWAMRKLVLKEWIVNLIP